MVRYYRSCADLKMWQLMDLYEDDLQEWAKRDYPDLPEVCAGIEARQDFYAFLQDVFFKTSGAVLALWQEQDHYISALRLEPYADGLLLCGIVTAKPYRRQGFGKKLVCEVLRSLPKNTKVYSHVNKENAASVSLHTACGFQSLSGPVKMLNGETLHNFLGFLSIV